MRYLRLLSNALFAGLAGALYLTVLVLQINPHLPLSSPAIGEWYAALAVLYGIHLAIACYVVMMLLELAGFPVSAPAWISVRLQAWMCGLLSVAASALMWLNLRAFSLTIGEEASRRMAAGAVGTSGVAVVLLVLAVVYSSVGRRGSRAAAAVLAIALGMSAALPVAARGFGGQQRPVPPRPLSLQPASPETPVPAGRIVMVLLEGASLEYLWPRAVEGKFPNFGRILDRGAAMDLATLRPTQPEPVWTAVATGKYPPKTGLASRARYHVRSRRDAVELLPDYLLAHALVRLGIVHEEPHTSASWGARPFWTVLGSRGVTSGIVRWPATYPASPVNGFLLTDRLHLVSASPIRLDDRAMAAPSDVLPVARDVFSGGRSIVEVAPVPAAAGGLETLQSQPTRWDRLYAQLAGELNQAYQPQLLAIRFTGIDAIGHAYLHYAVPRAFGAVPDAQVRQFGGVLDRYYAVLDAEIGEEIDALGPDGLLLVISGFGMEPMSLPKRLLAWALGEPPASGTHERAPDGFLLAYGAHVRSGKLQRGAVVDVAPTLLYYLGLPVGRDMDGYARTDLFVPEFTADRPIVFIGSYDRLSPPL